MRAVLLFLLSAGCFDDFDRFVDCTAQPFDPRCMRDGGGGSGGADAFGGDAMCGAFGTGCCASNPPCVAGATCNLTSNMCEPCGKPGYLCCAGVSCDSSLAVCSALVCVSKNVWVVDFQGQVAHWDGSGWTAAMQATPSQGSLAAINGTSALDVWAVGSSPSGASSQAAAYHLAGDRWIEYDMPSLRWLDGVRGTSSTDFWAVGSDGQAGGVAHFDGGLSWSTASLGSSTVVWALWAGGPSDVWAVGSASGQGVAFHWMNSSALGNPVVHPVPGSRSLTAIWGSGQGDVWALGYNADNPPLPILVYWPNGFSSTPMVLTVSGLGTDLLHAIWGSGSRDVWAVGEGLSIVHWTNGPNIMPEVIATGNGAAIFEGIWGSGPYDVWAIGSIVGSGTAVHWTGTAWSTSMTLPGLREARAVWGVIR